MNSIPPMSICLFTSCARSSSFDSVDMELVAVEPLSLSTTKGNMASSRITLYLPHLLPSHLNKPANAIRQMHSIEVQTARVKAAGSV